MKHRQRRVTPVWAFLLIVSAFAASAPGLTIMEEDWDANDVAYVYSTNATGDGAGTITWIAYSITEGGDHPYVSPPRHLHFGFGGGSGTVYGSLFWILDHEMDFWRGGTGEVSIQASRYGGASQARLMLYDGTTVVAEAIHSFEDWNTYHPITLELDGDETSVDLVVLMITRYSSPSSVHVCFDNFLFTADYRVCSDPTHPKKDADVNQDCYINLLDFAFIVGNWLECTDPTDETCIQ